MADSTYLKNVVEPFVVAWVSQQIGMPLSRRRIVVGPRGDGTPVRFEFDGVSSGGDIGLLVSTTQTVKPGGTRKLHMDASILLSTSFSRRLMAFISEDVRLNFVNKCDGLLPLRHIEMFVVDALPPEMSAMVSRFQSEAKAEVGDRGRQWKPGGQRR
jgi:hypothetical protein